MTRTPQLTAESKALLSTLGRRHAHLLAMATGAREMDREDWADIIGDEVVHVVREALPGIEAAAVKRALTAEAFHRMLEDAKAEGADAAVAPWREALGDLLAETWCVPSSGGSDGKWCVNHDTPMVDEDRCSLVDRLFVLLAARPASGGE